MIAKPQATANQPAALGEQAGEPGWLLLIHQLPPKPDYLRVKIWRRLQGLGAVAVKNSVYVLPRSEQALEDFQWLQKEIEGSGGAASVCEAAFLSGLDDDGIRALFNAARDADFRQLAEEAGEGGDGALSPEARAELDGRLRRLKRRLQQIDAVDFFNAPARAQAEQRLTALAARLRSGGNHDERAERGAPLKGPLGRTWVTRRGIFVDRMASAWLIGRFIDRDARFKFVDARTYKPRRHDLRFDMAEAEYTHEGDLCTFEVLLRRFGLDEGGLAAISEIVHDIDLKDGKFARAETPGIAELLEGIVAQYPGDEQRLAAAGPLFDALYSRFRSVR